MLTNYTMGSRRKETYLHDCTMIKDKARFMPTNYTKGIGEGRFMSLDLHGSN